MDITTNVARSDISVKHNKAGKVTGISGGKSKYDYTDVTLEDFPIEIKYDYSTLEIVHKLHREHPIKLNIYEGVTELLDHLIDRPWEVIISYYENTLGYVLDGYRNLLIEYVTTGELDKVPNKLAVLALRLAAMSFDVDTLLSLVSREIDVPDMGQLSVLNRVGSRYLRLMYGDVKIPADIDYTTMPVDRITLHKCPSIDHWVTCNRIKQNLNMGTMYN